MAGLSSNGFDIKRQPEIVADIELDQKTVFGDDLELDPSTLDAQLNGLLSDQLASVWELGLELYSGLDPRTAGGIMLDRISSIAGIIRQQAVPSTATLALTGDVGTVVPAGTIFSASVIPGVKFALDTEIVIDSLGNGIGEVTADTDGATIIAANTITTIDTPVSGLTEVTNPVAGQTGIDRETDEELRIRRAQSVALGSTSMVESIVANVANVEGVSRTKLYENIGTITDSNGIPAHSMEVIVSGGQDSDVAEAIALKRSAGCGLHGTTSSPYVDSNGYSHDVNFSRPVDKPIYIQITAVKTANWDINANERISQAVVDYANGDSLACGDFLGYDIADDVYGSQLVLGLAGEGSIIVKQILVEDVSPATLQFVDLGYNELASFDIANVEIIYV